MKKIIHITIIALSIGWLSLSFNGLYGPFAPVGKLFSYPEGIFFRTLPADELAFENTGYTCNIFLDAYGVPTIKGKTSKDVAFGLGFMHARDRYFQMEMITRTVQGTMSEVLGSLTLNSDKFWKPLNCDERAIADLEYLKNERPKVYEYMMSYSEGIRYYLQQEGGSEQFFEYALLGEQPREWKDHYPMLLSFYMSKILAYDAYDLAWATNLSHLSVEEYERFYKTQTENYPYQHADTFRTNQLSTQPVNTDSSLSLLPFDKVEQQKKLSIGSNNWAISKGKSASGNAILCNDTHLDITLPNPWYQAHLICDDFHTQGFTIPCSPYVLTGNNEYFAWGITNAQWDEVDMFKLQLAADSNAYMVDGKEMTFQRQENVINVKGSPDVIFTTQHSIFGLVKKVGGNTYAEKWHALDFNSSSAAFEGLTKGKNWDDFINGLKEYTYPPQNFAFADKNGNVGLITAGKLPVRPANYNGGLLDGSTAYHATYIEFEQLPQSYRGDSGYISSANQLQAATNYYANYTWVEPYRGARIQEVLSSKKQLTRADVKQLHIDQEDHSFHTTLKLFHSIPLEGRKKEWITELQAWNGQMSPELKTPIKYLVIYKALNGYFERYFKAKGVDWGPSYYNMVNVLSSNDTLKLGSELIATAAIKSEILDSALVLYDRFVTDETTYGQLSAFTMHHILRIPGLQASVQGKGGNSNTVDVNGHGIHGASMRTVIELGGETPKIETVIAGGQSGRVNSPHYKNQVEMWKTGAYHTIDFATPPAGNFQISFTK